MLLLTLAVLVAFAIGFGVGRIKNAAKLDAVKAEVTKAETAVSADAKALAAKIKSIL